MKRPIVSALFVALCTASSALAQPPSVGYLQPAGVQPGKATDVVFHGGNLANPTSLWTGFPCTAELTPGIDKNGTDPAAVTYRLTVPSETPLGVAGLRIVTGQGVSNLRLILVDDLPSVAKVGNNKTPETAQTLVLPVAVDGSCDAESSDFYKFAATEGQRHFGRRICPAVGFAVGSDGSAAGSRWARAGLQR